MASKILICLMLTLTITQLCYGSAIPMWEFLSRNEKMSHLYSIFAKLVSDYCKTSYEVRNIPVAQCKRDLLTYASDKLQEMPDTNLDLLDPYQRGANDLIWNTIMKDHPNVHPTTKRPQYNILQGSGIIGSSSSSSSNHIQTNISPTTSALSNDASIILFGNQINGYQKNPLFDGIDNSATSSLSSSSTNINGNGTFPSSSYAMEMDAAYGNYHIPNNNNNNKQQQYQQQNNNNNINNIKDSLINSSGIIASPLLSSNVNKQNNNNYQQIYQISNTEILHKPTSQNYIASALQHQQQQQQQHQSLIETSTNYLSGPLVIRVRPDGTPVEEDKYKPLPRDDDRDFIIGNHQFIRRQKNFIVPTSEFIVYPQQQQQQQQEQEQILQQQQQQYQRYQQRLRRQYRNSNSFRNIHRY